MVHSTGPALNLRAATEVRTTAGRAAAQVRERLTTTPGRMRLAGAAVVVGLLVLAVVGTGAVGARQRAATASGRQTEPLLVGTENLYSSLADADATATNSFLQGGLETPQDRVNYLGDLRVAGAALTQVAATGGTAAAVTHAIGVINLDLPLYTGLVESARANNRQGFPVGAAYLTEGSTMMQTQILPAAGKLYQVEAQRLNHAYDSGQSWRDVAGVVAVGLLALALLATAQLFLAQRTNRVLNLPMLAASILTLLVLAWTIAAFSFSATRLDGARRHGSDPVQLVSSAKILVARTQVDENLALVARGGDPQYLADFDAVVSALGPPGGSSGLLRQAETYPASSSVGDAYAAYLKAHQAVVTAETGGQFTTAVALATGAGANDEIDAASKLDGFLDGEIQYSQTVFTAQSRAAANDLSPLTFAVIGLAVVAAALALIGLEQRINEYR